MKTTDSRPDYEIAADELVALWASLGLTATITGAHAAIDETKGEGSKVHKWAHVAVIVTISRPAQVVNGRSIPAAAEAFPWKMGVGLAKWADVRKAGRLPSEQAEIDAMRAHGSRLTPESQIAICAKHLGAFVKAVNPAEVLANACRDGQSAETDFETWAGEFGYDTDSRAAEATYFACQRAGKQARNLLDRETYAKFADLACRL